MSTPLLFFVFCLLFPLHSMALSSTGTYPYADAVWNDGWCNLCARNSSRCSTSLHLYNYCGTGVVWSNATKTAGTYDMCCQDVNYANATNGWECVSYSGPLDNYDGKVVSGFQCYSPSIDKAATLAGWYIIFACVVIIAICCCPFITCCLCCYCCGRCKRDPSRTPTAVVRVMPSFMLQQPAPSYGVPLTHDGYARM